MPDSIPFPSGERPYNAERQAGTDRQFNADQLFSLKEWMASISFKLDRMETMLGTKAEVSHVREVEIRVGQLEKQVTAAEVERTYYAPQHAQLIQDVGQLKTMSVSAISVDTPQHTQLIQDVATLKTLSASATSVDTYKRWIWTASVGSFAGLCLGAISILAR